ncbi:ATP-binding cassette domain-containing protein [Clostridium estertheticum]|uniref:ATP-binding cassette domain-containing protein n=1 Tax=Clostridium estertheticum TaxID=238834 RepID=UPI0013EEAC79|nr:ATP-binding cassette domain-containing protein [Clostridium estertheticum]MBZ9609657.1 ATP-binding cassette domain-containing protein [Clostridium estertheticum]
MLRIKGLYKEQKNNVIRDIDININKGSSISIECSNEVSDLLVNLILGNETPAKGEIYIEDVRNDQYIKTNIGSIGVVLREEDFYERMTIEDYMKFFSSLLGVKVDYKEIMLKVGLLDSGDIKIKNLNYSQRRRLRFARERLKQPKLLIFQEPILNMDSNGAKIIVENIEELRSEGTAVLIIFLMIPIFAKLNKTLTRIAEFLPNYNMNLMLEKVFKGQIIGVESAYGIFVILAWIVIAAGAFAYIYNKRGLDK